MSNIEELLSPPTSVSDHPAIVKAASLSGPTSRVRPFDFPKGYAWHYTLEGTQTETLTLSHFFITLTEETLQVGNISTHVKLAFTVGSRLHRANIHVIIKAYETKGFLYDIRMPLLDVHCRPDHDYSYDSGMILLAENHFDIIVGFNLDFDHKLFIPFCG